MSVTQKELSLAHSSNKNISFGFSLGCLLVWAIAVTPASPLLADGIPFGSYRIGIETPSGKQGVVAALGAHVEIKDGGNPLMIYADTYDSCKGNDCVFTFRPIDGEDDTYTIEVRNPEGETGIVASWGAHAGLSNGGNPLKVHKGDYNSCMKDDCSFIVKPIKGKPDTYTIEVGDQNGKTGYIAAWGAHTGPINGRHPLQVYVGSYSSCAKNDCQFKLTPMPLNGAYTMQVEAPERTGTVAAWDLHMGRGKAENDLRAYGGPFENCVEYDCDFRFEPIQGKADTYTIRVRNRKGDHGIIASWGAHTGLVHGGNPLKVFYGDYESCKKPDCDFVIRPVEGKPGTYTIQVQDGSGKTGYVAAWDAPNQMSKGDNAPLLIHTQDHGPCGGTCEFGLAPVGPRVRTLTKRSLKSAMEKGDDNYEFKAELSAEGCKEVKNGGGAFNKWHVQSIARLPDQVAVGTADRYYMGTLSHDTGGVIWIWKHQALSAGGGKIVWCHQLNGSADAFGKWSHPAQVGRVGDEHHGAAIMMVVVHGDPKIGDHPDGILFLDVTDPEDVKKYSTILRPPGVHSPDIATFTVGPGPEYVLAIGDEGDDRRLWVLRSKHFDSIDPGRTWTNVPSQSAKARFQDAAQNCDYLRDSDGKNWFVCLFNPNQISDENKVWAIQTDSKFMPYPNNGEYKTYYVDNSDGKIGFGGLSFHYCDFNKAGGTYIDETGELYFLCSEGRFDGDGLGYTEASAK